MSANPFSMDEKAIDQIYAARPYRIAKSAVRAIIEDYNIAKRPVSIRKCAEALYRLKPQPDGITRYSRGIQVSADLRYDEISDLDKEALLEQAKSVLDAAGVKYST